MASPSNRNTKVLIYVDFVQYNSHRPVFIDISFYLQTVPPVIDIGICEVIPPSTERVSAIM